MTRTIELPAWWWGPFESDGDVLPVEQHVRDGLLSPELAEWLGLLIGAGASTMVCAGPSGAGKSTLLNSLCTLLSETRDLYFVRGWFDPLAVETPNATALLIPEISQHLPGYLWGPGLDAAHRLAANGVQLMATAHALEPRDLIRQLLAYPHESKLRDLACWDIVIFLDAWMEGRRVARRVRRIDTFATLADSSAAQTIVARGEDDAWLLNRGALIALAGRLGISEQDFPAASITPA